MGVMLVIEFACNLDVNNAFYAELVGVMLAIEFAHKKCWHCLWIETYLQLVTMAFKSRSIVPWNLRNSWLIYITITSSTQFIISHNFREVNQCVDRLANLGLQMDIYHRWDSIPPTILNAFIRNRLSLPEYRFC